METNSMYRPIISDKDCDELSGKTGLNISNRNYKGDRWPVVKDGTLNIDTSFSFQSKDTRWSDIAKEFSGDVLVLGLGFGKSIINACENDKVKSITVVEIREGIIDMFWLAHGHEFKGVKKLKIVNKDAFEYKETEFDHVFIDIFHDTPNKGLYKEQSRQLRDAFKNSIVHQISL